MSKDISDLRNHLFTALEGLADKNKPMEIERARAIADVAQTIINSAKVEVDRMKISGGIDTGFLAGHIKRLENKPRRKRMSSRRAPATPCDVTS